jgi:hypothetical protein
MGKYVNETSKGGVGSSADSKCQAILNDGGVEIPEPKEFVPNLVCVVNNGMFGAAAYAYSERELKDFTMPGDYRPKRWFIWEKVEQYAQ